MKKLSGIRSFRNAVATLWNMLPDTLHKAKDIASFWWQLKPLFAPKSLATHPHPKLALSPLSLCPIHIFSSQTPTPPFTKPNEHAAVYTELNCLIQVDSRTDSLWII